HHESTERQEAAQRLDARRARQIERELAGEIQKRRLVQRVGGGGDRHRHEIDVDRRALVDLPREALECARPRIPRRARAELELAKLELAARADREGPATARQGERRDGAPEQLSSGQHRSNLPEGYKFT